jgi:tripartite-type tricarboxylate transporter receptor subunit TctC
MVESGGPPMILASWYALLAPAGTPREVIAKLHAEVVKALAQPDLRERFAATGIEPWAIHPISSPRRYARTSSAGRRSSARQTSAPSDR